MECSNCRGHKLWVVLQGSNEASGCHITVKDGQVVNNPLHPNKNPISFAVEVHVELTRLEPGEQQVGSGGGEHAPQLQ